MFKKLAALALFVTAPSQAAVLTTGIAGGGEAFSNYQPSLVLNQRVQTQGIFPCRDCGGGGATIGRSCPSAWSLPKLNPNERTMPIVAPPPPQSRQGKIPWVCTRWLSTSDG